MLTNDEIKHSERCHSQGGIPYTRYTMSDGSVWQFSGLYGLYFALDAEVLPDGHLPMYDREGNRTEMGLIWQGDERMQLAEVIGCDIYDGTSDWYDFLDEQSAEDVFLAALHVWYELQEYQ